MADSTCPLVGEWTIHHAATHHGILMGLIQEGTHRFDASGVTDFDSAGLQLLLSARQSLLAQGLEFQLTTCSTCVQDVLQAYGLDSTLSATHQEHMA